MQSKVSAETVKLMLEHGANPTKRDYWRGISRSPLEILLSAREDLNWLWGMGWEKLTLLLTYGAADNLCEPIPPSESRKPYPFIYYYFDFPEILRLIQRFIDTGVDLTGWTAECGVPPIHAVIWWAEVRCTVLDPKEIEKVPDIICRMRELVALMAEATLIAIEPNHQANSLAKQSTLVDTPFRMFNRSEDGTGYRGYKIAAHQPTPLSYVCSPLRFLGSTQLIDTLLRFGANINAASNEGVTALHHAVMFSTGVAVRLLVEPSGGPALSGLNVNALDSRGWTPLHYACHFGFSRRQREQADAVRLLLDHGANIHARTSRGITPLLIAVWCSNGPVFEVLLDRGAGKEDMSVESFDAMAF